MLVCILMCNLELYIDILHSGSEYFDWKKYIFY